MSAYNVENFKGAVFVVHIHLKWHLMRELPETDEGVAQWCKDIFVDKDALIDKHQAADTFEESLFQPIGQLKKSLLVAFSWLCLLSWCTYKVFQWFQMLSTWKGIAISAPILLLVTVIMHVFILFSQSELSTPAKVAPCRLGPMLHQQQPLPLQLPVPAEKNSSDQLHG